MSDISFTQLIQKVDAVSVACIQDEVKLRYSGEFIYKASEQILQKANNLLSSQSTILGVLLGSNK